MLSNGRIVGVTALLLSAALLAGCASGGGGGYRDAPRLSDPSLADTAMRESRADVPLALSAATPQRAPGASYALPEDIVAQAAPETHSAMAPPEGMPQGDGPRATSGTARYDAVGYAGNDGSVAGQGTAIAHGTLPVGSVVELTALDTGKTILAEVTEALPTHSNRIAALSAAAAAALGVMGDPAAVRVRLTAPSPQDRIAMQGGGVATRADTPPVLLVALRKRLSPASPIRAAAMAPTTHADAPGARYRSPGAVRASAGSSARPSIGAGGGYFVQIAALSDAARARALAARNNARTVPGGGFYRVQIGPYADQKSAQQARDGIARHGYGDARIVKAN